MVELVRKAKKGDKESFTKLIEHVQEYGYRVAYTYMKNEEDSMDVVCDSVEKAYRKLHTLRKDEGFKTWFIQIVKNQSVQQLRKKQRQQKFIEENRREQRAFEEWEVDDIMDLRHCIEEIPAIEQEILHQRFWQDKKFKDIAVAISLPISSVKTKYYTTLKKLKKSMEVHPSEKK